MGDWYKMDIENWIEWKNAKCDKCICYKCELLYSCNEACKIEYRVWMWSKRKPS